MTTEVAFIAMLIRMWIQHGHLKESSPVKLETKSGNSMGSKRWRIHENSRDEMCEYVAYIYIYIDIDLLYIIYIYIYISEIYIYIHAMVIIL